MQHPAAHYEEVDQHPASSGALVIASEVENSVAYAICCCILVLLLVGLPKGGIKYESIPLTFSYLALALVSGPMLLLSLSRGHINRLHVLTLCAVVPFIAIASTKTVLFGWVNLGQILSLITNIIVIPIIFLIALGGALRAFSKRSVQRFFVGTILCITVFGLLEFLSRNYLKVPIDIPYLTINADDLGTVANKYNNRGALIKLVSTYQNGNIFGVCMLMMGPLYFHIENKNKLGKILFLLAMFLSLSRTVWAGMLLWLMLWETIYRRRLIGLLLRSPVFITLGCLIGASGIWLLSANSDFLLDRTLGGRLTGLEYLEVSLVGRASPYFGIGEMTYVSILNEFGIIGILMFALWLVAPVVVHLSFVSLRNSSGIERACIVGLVLYWLVAAVDGAFALIPVVPQYWLLATILLSSRSLTHTFRYSSLPNSLRDDLRGRST